MTIAVFHKLLAIFLTVGLGWAAGRLRWLGERDGPSDPARVLSNAAFYIFVPALLFRTMVRLDVAALPWGTLSAYFVPAFFFTLGVYLVQRRSAARFGPAAPATRTVGAIYGNAVQLGIPTVSALFGEAGLALHIALVSLHGLVLLTLLTVLVELDLARHGAAHPMDTLRTTLRNAFIHPVVLPVLLGLGWNATGLGLHPIVDETLAGLGSAVVPVCLVLIGISLAYYGTQGQVRGAVGLLLVKLLLMPAVVLAAAYWGFGLRGLPLNVVVMMAALPTGANALIFAQRYEVMQSEATAVIVFSTVAYAASASLWIGVLTLLH